MIGRLLVGLGGTPYAESATRTAIDIALRNEAAITGVTIANLEALHVVGPVPIGAGHLAKELGEHRIAVTRQAVEEAVDRFVTLCTEAGVEYKIKKEERDEPLDFLISRARYHDLTVLGLQSIFKYDAPGARHDDPALTLVKLISGGVRPIIAVPKTPPTVKRVMIAYSGSIESASTMRRFLQLRPWTDIQVKVVTFGMTPERSHRLLDQAAKYCQCQQVEVETEAIDAAPEHHVLEAAQACSADLIVLGNSAKSLLLRRMLGETALTVIREAELPLFLAQ